jgi:hypothetical protein
MLKIRLLLCSFLIIAFTRGDGFAQISRVETKSGWFSLGGRSTLSAFDGDGGGLGTGGQFSLQLSDRVNTAWFADYITINISDKIRSEYFHIGWSVMFYPFDKLRYPRVLQPYVLAGHCFDYNKKSVIQDPSISKDRWGSAVQAGIGTHINLTDKFDISLTCQYMTHLTKALEVVADVDQMQIAAHDHPSLEGHLLATVSFNYKFFQLW